MQTGAVITFKEEVSVEQAEEILASINELFVGKVLPITGEIPHNAVDSMQVQEFDPSWGSPVFYIP